MAEAAGRRSKHPGTVDALVPACRTWFLIASRNRTALQQSSARCRWLVSRPSFTMLVAGSAAEQDGHPCHRATKGLTCIAFWRISKATIVAIPGTRTSATPAAGSRIAVHSPQTFASSGLCAPIAKSPALRTMRMCSSRRAYVHHIRVMYAGRGTPSPATFSPRRRNTYNARGR